MIALRIGFGLFAAFAQASAAQTADILALPRGASYEVSRTMHETFLAGSPTKAERLEAMRQMVRSSRYGERGLRQIFKNFEGAYSIDPEIPGVEKSARLLRSGSKHQAKGYVRELAYASSFHNDPRFSLKAMNQVRQGPWGLTDADIVNRHRPTGVFSRIEVKDVSLTTQQTNIRKYKVQIDKMAREARLTGERQFWFNRRGLSPAIQEYARKNGVIALGSVKTGRFSKGLSIDEARQIVHRESIRVDRVRTTLSTASIVYGLVLFGKGASGLAADMERLSATESISTEDWLRLGENASTLVAGAGMVGAGSAVLGRKLAGQAHQLRLTRIARLGGLVSVGALVVGQGLLVSRYVRGDVSSREFWTAQWKMGAGMIGATAGTWAGGLVGGATANPIGSVGGAFLGGAAGAYVGDKFAGEAVGRYYALKFDRLDEDFGRFVYARYGVQ